MDIINNSKFERLAKFKPRARLLQQLGDQLIKNESIALLELAKNSYDADASFVDIKIYNHESKEEGYIVIEDDGFGMTADTIENVWLEPGSSFKKTQFDNREVTPKFKRLPIGEKGIGRFGAHKLGDIVELTTKHKDGDEVYVKIDWTVLDKYSYLEEVPIRIISRKNPQVFTSGKTGTKIEIRNFRNDWSVESLKDIYKAIQSLTSPFDYIDQFKPSFSVVGNPKMFEKEWTWQTIKNYSLYKFDALVSGNSIVKFVYEFTPWETMTKLKERRICETDSCIKSLLLQNESGMFDLNDFKIGTFRFIGYVFDLDTYILKMGVSQKREFKNYLKSNGGVRIYRDNLRVYDYGEPENDWLELDFRRFQSPTKAISNNLIIGAIGLIRDQSEDLIEKTNREGFVDNDAYDYFKCAALNVIEQVENLRQIDKGKMKDIYGATPKSEPVINSLSELAIFIDENVQDETVRIRLKADLCKIERDYTFMTENLLKAAGAGLNMSVVVHEIEKITYELTKVLYKECASERAQKLVKRLSNLVDGYADLIRNSKREKAKIVDVIDQALFNCEYRLESHRIHVEKQYLSDKSLSTVKSSVSWNLMIGTIMNLIDNSIYWLDQKNFECINKEVPYAKKLYVGLLIDEKDMVNIVVADNGLGFSLPTESVTEPFVSGKKNGAGMGLGLHIASEIMAAHKGSISFPDFEDLNLPHDYSEGAIVMLTLKRN